MASDPLSRLPDPASGRSGWPWTEQCDSLPKTRSDGDTWPKISIVTPSYNQGQFIEETIRSVLLQGYPNLEYIVMDGGSTDETVEILERYDPWIDHWVSEPDDGQSDAINKGLERATGTIFNWINSDDLLEPGALGTIAQHFEDTDAVIGLGRHFTDEESWLEETYNFAPRPLLRVAGGGKGCGFTQQAVWLNTEQVRACGGVDPSFHYAMDRELYVRYTYDYPEVTYVEQSLARFRIHEDSKTERSDFGVRDDNPFQRDFLRMTKKIRRSDTYPELHDVCEQTIERLEWRLCVAKAKRIEDRSRAYRACKLLWEALRRPRERLDRSLLSSVFRILLNIEDKVPLLAWPLGKGRG